MSDNQITTPQNEVGAASVPSAAVEASLREHVARAEEHLQELEESMEGMLRDHDTIQEDRDQTRTLIESVRADMQRAQRALDRIEAGTFGQCVDCGGPIAPARLEAIPEADRCTDCA